MVFRALAALFPAVCLACRAPGADLCSACRWALSWLPAPLCPRCGLPAPHGARCPAAAAAFERAWAPLEYAGPARALVLALKARRALAAADIMAAQVAAGLPRDLRESAVLVPVPAHREGVRARGFDHAELLALALHRRTGLPVMRCLRRRQGARQAGADRATRLAGTRLAIQVRGRTPPRALLVDDVHTTGATLHACAAALRQSGSHWVGAATYARTVAQICSPG